MGMERMGRYFQDGAKEPSKITFQLFFVSKVLGESVFQIWFFHVSGKQQKTKRQSDHNCIGKVETLLPQPG